MIQTWEGAGELRPSPDANGTNGHQTILSALYPSSPAKPQRTPQPTYSPLGVRPCARCGSRTDWRQIPALGGGWLCCPSRELLDANRDILTHQCGPSCLLGVA